MSETNGHRLCKKKNVLEYSAAAKITDSSTFNTSEYPVHVARRMVLRLVWPPASGHGISSKTCHSHVVLPERKCKSRGVNTTLVASLVVGPVRPAAAVGTWEW